MQDFDLSPAPSLHSPCGFRSRPFHAEPFTAAALPAAVEAGHLNLGIQDPEQQQQQQQQMSHPPAAAEQFAGAVHSSTAAPPRAANQTKRSSRQRHADINALLDNLGDGLTNRGSRQRAPADDDAAPAADGLDEQQQQHGTADVLLLDADGDGASGGSCLDAGDAVEACFHLGRSDVLARIEQIISDAVLSISQGELLVLRLVSRASSNIIMQQDDGGPAATGSTTGSQWGASQGDPAAAGAAAKRLKLGSKLQQKSLTANKGAQANSYVRIFAVLEAVHELLRLGKQATQRDLYYMLQDQPFFSTANDVNTAIQDVVALLRVPRSSLGITCASKGSVVGNVCIKDSPAAAWQDCSLMGSAGKAIPGQVSAIQSMCFRVSARYIIVVEKDAIFQRLAEDRLFDALPCILVTARGMPDLATRVFLHHLQAAAPGVTLLGLVDWNPAGVAIMCTYKFGNERMALECSRYALPALQWLGVTSDMLQEVPDEVLKPLTKRDKAMLPRLKQRLEGFPDWQQQLTDMEDAELVADIEALYSTCGYEGLKQLLINTVLQHKCLV